jgi:3-oxoacyl-[acyl-carrier protein] reductase
VSKAADVKAAVDACVAAFGPPDIVVNNAGITHTNQSMIDVDEATFDRVFNVNVKSIYHMARAVVPVMRGTKKGGSIINIGSTAGIRPRPNLTWYNASKGAVNTASKSMAVELGPDNIRVNAICPVMGATGLIGQFLGQDTPENRAKVTAGIPLGRLSTPEDIAAAALYLASDAGRFITGVELPVDGGRTI